MASDPKKAKTSPPPAKPQLKDKASMPNLQACLAYYFTTGMLKAYPDQLDADTPCPIALASKQGDYQYNGAMAIAGILKASRFILCRIDVSEYFLKYFILPKIAFFLDETHCIFFRNRARA